MPAAPVVLLIEDHTALGEVIRDFMTKEGYEVLAVRDPSEAAATLRDRRIDMVVADLPAVEPGQTDPLAEIIRDFPDIPVVSVVEDARGAVPFFGPWRRSSDRVTLRRPFRLNDLLAVTRELAG